MMTISRAGAADLRLHEGFIGKWYKDPVGVGTIGIGFTWNSPAFRRWWGMVKNGQTFGPGAMITRTEADEALVMLSNEQYGKALNEYLGHDVPQHVFDAAHSVVFNCGEGALAWKWAEAMKIGDYDEAARLVEGTAVTATGPDGKKVKLKGLVNRRKDEARLMRDGVYVSLGSTGPTMPADDDKSDDDGVLRTGERGASIAKMQAKLQALGLYEGIIDGIFGIGTELAVRQFQEKNGKLTVDGVAGQKTLKALEA